MCYLLALTLTRTGLTPPHSRTHGAFTAKLFSLLLREGLEKTRLPPTISVHAVHPFVELFHFYFHNGGCVFLKNRAKGEQKVYWKGEKKKCDVLSFILGEPRMLAVHRKMNSIHCLTLQVDGACTLFKCTKL